MPSHTTIFPISFLPVLLASALSCYEGAPVPPHDFVSDTTSHNFTWQVDILGDGNGSFLSDVGIINDTLACAVGQFNVLDSSGAWKNPSYNVARWNGTSWAYSTVPDSGLAAGSPLWCVLAFAVDDLWVGSGTPQHWDGTRWTRHDATRGYTARPGLRIRRMWGVNSRDVYAVGDGGQIWHYNGVTWKELSSGTSLDFRDVYGAWNLWTSAWQILAVGSKYPVNFDRTIVELSGETVTPHPSYPIQYSVQGIWFVPNRYFAVVGSGIYEKKTLDEPVWRNGPQDITRSHTNAVRGLDVNDVFVVGVAGEILHYNGMSWHSFVHQTAIAGDYNAVAVKGDLVVAVGTVGLRAIVARGHRMR